jgi:hypothetical protein
VLFEYVHEKTRYATVYYNKGLLKQPFTGSSSVLMPVINRIIIKTNIATGSEGLGTPEHGRSFDMCKM